MNYVKSCLIITMLLGIGYSQCDANGDGDLNILDIIEEVNCILTNCWEGELICDIDGICYETIRIGAQLWMAENLKVTHYNNGDEIPTGYSDEDWFELETGAYAVYPTDNDETSQSTCGDDCADIYGNLYNWYVVDDDRGLCMEGWHVPSFPEVQDLLTYLGGQTAGAGGKMKSTGTIEDGDGLWYAPNEGATNESGFTALPGGHRRYSYNNSYYGNMGNGAIFWTSPDMWNYSLSYSSSTNYYSPAIYERDGFSIRCLED